MTSMMQLEARRSAGSRDASSFDSERASCEPAGWTIAVAWKLMVAGGIGATNDRIPPRRTGTVTATRRLAATCLAFQLSGATATYSRRPTVLYTTPLDRGSPAGVTWLRTANDALASWCQTCSVVRRAAICWPSSLGAARVTPPPAVPTRACLCWMVVAMTPSSPCSDRSLGARLGPPIQDQ